MNTSNTSNKNLWIWSAQWWEKMRFSAKKRPFREYFEPTRFKE